MRPGHVDRVRQLVLDPLTAAQQPALAESAAHLRALRHTDETSAAADHS